MLAPEEYHQERMAERRGIPRSAVCGDLAPVDAPCKTTHKIGLKARPIERRIGSRQSKPTVAMLHWQRLGINVSDHFRVTLDTNVSFSQGLYISPVSLRRFFCDEAVNYSCTDANF